MAKPNQTLDGNTTLAFLSGAAVQRAADLHLLRTGAEGEVIYTDNAAACKLVICNLLRTDLTATARAQWEQEGRKLIK